MYKRQGQHRELLGQFAVAHDLDAVADFLDDTHLDQLYGGDGCAVVEHLKAGDVDRHILLAEVVGEATLGQARCV